MFPPVLRRGEQLVNGLVNVIVAAVIARALMCARSNVARTALLRVVVAVLDVSSALLLLRGNDSLCHVARRNGVVELRVVYDALIARKRHVFNVLNALALRGCRRVLDLTRQVGESRFQAVNRSDFFDSVHCVSLLFGIFMVGFI